MSDKIRALERLAVEGTGNERGNAMRALSQLSRFTHETVEQRYNESMDALKRLERLCIHAADLPEGVYISCEQLNDYRITFDKDNEKFICTHESGEVMYRGDCFRDALLVARGTLDNHLRGFGPIPMGEGE